MISAEDLERFTQLEEQRARRFEILDRTGEAFKNVPAEEIDREVARAISEVRAERQAKSKKRS